MLYFKESAIDSGCSTKYRLLSLCAREQLSKDNYFRSYLPCLFYHPSGNIQLGSMQIVQSKAIEILSHCLNIFFHILPGWRIFRRVPISNSDQVTPDRNFAPKIIKVVGCDEIFAGISTHNPAIIKGRDNLSSFGVHYRKIRVNKGERIIIWPVMIV